MTRILESGIFVFSEAGRYQQVVPAGVELPVDVYHNFSTAEDNQSSITIDIAVGVPPDNVRLVLRLLIDNIKLAKKGVAQIEVVFKIDDHNQMTFDVHDSSTRSALPFSMQRYQ